MINKVSHIMPALILALNSAFVEKKALFQSRFLLGIHCLYCLTTPADCFAKHDVSAGLPQPFSSKQTYLLT